MAPAPLTLPLRLYGALGPFLAIPALWRSDGKLREAGIPGARLTERRGRAAEPRPDGPLIWIHAASVGESLSALPLVTRLQDAATVLVTTGTGTSARIMADRLPPGALHRFAPIDARRPAQAFLDHWRPDLGVFVESEIWPTLILAAEARGMPLALVNARLSPASLRTWGRFPATARRVFRAFGLIVAQDDATRSGLATLTGTAVRDGGNLKAAVPAPAAPEGEIADWTARLEGRPVWTASSTHPGEDEAVLAAHRIIAKTHPGALCLLVPRHPERGVDIAHQSEAAGFVTARRAAGEAPGTETQVYVADTIGETGLWYRVAPIVFLAGSFGDAGGHNPWEPVACGAALLHGPAVPNAAADYRHLAALGAARQVDDAGALAAAVIDLLDDPGRVAAARESARNAAGKAEGMADALARDLLGLMERGR